MASLTRVFAKLFGGTADPNVTGEIGQFGSAKAGTKLNTADIATIQALSAYDKGWSAAVVTSRNYPPIEEVTGVLKTLSYQICYMLQEGVAEYNAETEYKTGSFCKSNNQIYASLVNSNVGNAVSDTTKWQPVFLPLTGGTMTGNLTVNVSTPRVNVRDSNEVAGTTPSSNITKQVNFQDKNGTLVGYVGNTYGTNGARSSALGCRSADASNGVAIIVGYDSNGNAFSSTVVPPDSSNSNYIATTSFVRGWAYGKIGGTAGTSIITTSTSVNGSTDIPYNLGSSGYLPSDYTDYAYEVLVSLEGKTGTNVGDYMNISIYSDLVGALDSAKAKCVVSGRDDLCSWSGWIPVTNGRIWLVRSPNWTGSIEKFVARAYRRLN